MAGLSALEAVATGSSTVSSLLSGRGAGAGLRDVTLLAAVEAHTTSVVAPAVVHAASRRALRRKVSLLAALEARASAVASASLSHATASLGALTSAMTWVSASVAVAWGTTGSLTLRRRALAGNVSTLTTVVAVHRKSLDIKNANWQFGVNSLNLQYRHATDIWRKQMTKAIYGGAYLMCWW